MANEATQQLLERAQAAADAARQAAEAAQHYADQIGAIAGAAAHSASGGAIDPFVFRLAIFAMAVFVGYYVVWSVTPALHTPLMSVTNAISGVIVVGALLQIGIDNTLGLALATIAILVASINVFGGFAVTRRMLAMFSKGA